nr:glycerol kinase [candidate division Zixibacteria bacterium]
NLTKERVHITDFSNASRTMVFNIFDKEWDKTILDILEIPYGILPQVRASSEFYGFSDPCLLGAEIPISGIAGDQQASLFGQTCFERGSAKNTYGTGCFMLLNIGEDPILSKNGLITTIAWGINGDVEYALEGSIFIGGAVIAWLRDGLGIIKSVGESESLALSVEDNGGVYLVPAFAGLGAPHWDMYARGTVFGLTGGTSRSHIVRAALESIAYQTRDVMECMEGETGLRFKQLKVDGGAIANRFLMQFQADILGIPVICAGSAETTAQGAAYLAGLAVGFWKNQSELSERWRAGRIFQPEMESDRRQLLHGQWEKALERTKYWLTE